MKYRSYLRISGIKSVSEYFKELTISRFSVVLNFYLVQSTVSSSEAVSVLPCAVFGLFYAKQKNKEHDFMLLIFLRVGSLDLIGGCFGKGLCTNLNAADHLVVR